MKKFLALVAIIAFVAAFVFPVAQAADFSNWKCSQCGMTRHMAGLKPPPDYGCKVSGNGKHIWFKN